MQQLYQCSSVLECSATLELPQELAADCRCRDICILDVSTRKYRKASNLCAHCRSSLWWYHRARWMKEWRGRPRWCEVGMEIFRCSKWWNCYQEYSSDSIEEAHEEMRLEVLDFEGGNDAEQEYIDLYWLLCDYKHHLVKYSALVQKYVHCSRPFVEFV